MSLQSQMNKRINILHYVDHCPMLHTKLVICTESFLSYGPLWWEISLLDNKSCISVSMAISIHINVHCMQHTHRHMHCRDVYNTLPQTCMTQTNVLHNPSTDVNKEQLTPKKAEETGSYCSTSFTRNYEYTACKQDELWTYSV